MKKRDALQAGRIDSLERLIETDEVFVLLSGNGRLLMGGNGTKIAGIYPQLMEHGKVYDLKRTA